MNYWDLFEDGTEQKISVLKLDSAKEFENQPSLDTILGVYKIVMSIV